MTEIKCSVIEDLLPLYVDEVVSDDTKELVEAHLKTCECCRQEYEQMKGILYVPIEHDTSMFEHVQKRWNQKKWLLILSSTLIVAMMSVALFSLTFHYTKPIAYTPELFKVEQQSDGTLMMNYYGDSHAGSNFMHPVKMNINGEEKNVSFVFYEQSFANSPTRTNLRTDVTSEGDHFTLPESEKIDAVYYGEFDEKEFMKREEQIKHMTLIWER